ncbi:MAG TPA: alpha/beta hydrolase [Pseudonocardiaceae bacterium]|jgi:dienelactone hydrolase|nr:alpha/beta hydrolase [Pseudonocardiaceae bacterium]
MRVTAEHIEKDVTERHFELEVAGDRVPGILWTPADATGPRPLVLMGHGGSQHKRVDTHLARARHYVRALGFAVAAIDAPDHGDRVTPEQAAAFARSVRERIQQRRQLGGEGVRQLAERARKAVPEWQATLDALRKLDIVGDNGPVGYWGVSMGTAIGVPFVAAEPRITAAVFGLAGLHPESTALAEAANKITIPVEFVFQWDDEIAGHEAGIALFDAFGSTEKSMHINPGGHLGIPMFERDSWERFFTRHLVR